MYKSTVYIYFIPLTFAGITFPYVMLVVKNKKEKVWRVIENAKHVKNNNFVYKKNK